MLLFLFGLGLESFKLFPNTLITTPYFLSFERKSRVYLLKTLNTPNKKRILLLYLFNNCILARLSAQRYP